MSEGRRAKLEAIRQREQLKGMLITKFKNKYSTPGNELLINYIDSEVKRFIKEGDLTEENLKTLDQKILLRQENGLIAPSADQKSTRSELRPPSIS
jgi:hypothetical protein